MFQEDIRADHNLVDLHPRHFARGREVTRRCRLPSARRNFITCSRGSIWTAAILCTSSSVTPRFRSRRGSEACFTCTETSAPRLRVPARDTPRGRTMFPSRPILVLNSSTPARSAFTAPGPSGCPPRTFDAEGAGHGAWCPESFYA
jgi:hypothetical protein